MKKYHVYHGTVTGKDDIFLESFIVTGAVSGKTINPNQQSGGFYACVGSVGEAYLFSQTRSQMEDQDEYTLRCGRGMVVEFETELNAKDWNFDHEDAVDSARVIRQFKDTLPLLTFGIAGSSLKDTPTETPFSIKKKDDDTIVIDYEDLRGEKRSCDMVFRGDGGFDCSEPVPTFFLEQIHKTLEKEFPERYLQVKQKAIDDMAEAGHGGCLKYIGSQPLRVNKIYLRPEDSPIIEDNMDRKDPLKRWEVVYENKTSLQDLSGGPKPASIRQSAAIR